MNGERNALCKDPSCDGHRCEDDALVNRYYLRNIGKPAVVWYWQRPKHAGQHACIEHDDCEKNHDLGLLCRRSRYDGGILSPRPEARTEARTETRKSP